MFEDVNRVRRGRLAVIAKRTRRALLAAAVLLALSAPAALGHAGDPNFRSEIQDVSPEVGGLSLEVLNYDDRLLLRNDTGQVVTVVGYEGEPYARLQPDGTVEVNRLSPAVYLNEDRFAQIDVPGRADPDAAPDWEVIGRNGSFEWHDHRIHWMVEDRRPPQVTDPDVETKVFDWRVPIEVGKRRGAIEGELRWVPLPGGGFPLVAAISLGAVAILAVLAVLIIRRRRSQDRERSDLKEAW